MSKEENRVYFSKKDITFYGDTEKEKKLNEQLFDASLLIAQKDDEIKELNNIINECANDILKELKKNNHLSYGVALAIRQKLIDYRELKSGDKE